MNQKALDAITSPCPDDYSKFVRFIAAICMSRSPKYKRPREGTAWQIVAWTLVIDAPFRSFMGGRGPMGLSKFVATVIDVWGYWLNEE